MARESITHKAGDTFSWSLVRVDDAGDPVNLSGVPVDMYFVRGPAVISVGGSVTDAAAGEVTFTVDASDTTDWIAGLYHGDITFGTSSTTSASTATFSLTVERGYDG